MSDIKNTLKDAGQRAAEAAKEVGHTVAEKAGQAAHWVEEKTGLGHGSCGATHAISGIREHMDVVASCGTKVGVVDHVEGAAIKLTRTGSPDGQHHFIPVAWVDHVDNHVHLKKNSQQAMQEWKSSAEGCSAVGA